MLLPSSLSVFLLTLLHPVRSSILPPHAQAPLNTVPPPTSSSPAKTPLPLIIWHGLGDSYDADGLVSVAELANATNPGTHVHLIHLGDSGDSDRSASYFGNLTDQIAEVCEQLQSDPILSLAPAVNALGFSQGGQFLRGYIERCNDPPVRNFVTYGSPHNGISEFESCSSATDWVCQGANALLRAGTWSSLVQSRLVPAQYFRDPEELAAYLENSNYLADINNERKLKNTTYKKNLSKLNKFVMYMFEDDTVLVPKESSWFAEVNRTSEDVTKLKDRKLYKEDWIGLKELDEKDALVFTTLPGGHMALDEDNLKEVFKQYFAPEK